MERYSPLPLLPTEGTSAYIIPAGSGGKSKHEKINYVCLLTIKELYRHYLIQLQSIYDLSESTIITDKVFEKIAGFKRTDMVRQIAGKVPPAIAVQLKDNLTQLLDHRPLQYVLGETWFYHLKFKVNEQVLIPRPETEELVEAFLLDPRSKMPGISILDIGTGSGCIPVSIRKNRPQANLTAIEISKAALEVAEENALNHLTPVDFRQLDFLNEKEWKELPLFDIVISNPPYIPFHEKEKIARNVEAYEPHLALFVPDNNPLLFYEKIASFSKTHLTRKGKIYLETHQDLAKDVAAIFNIKFADVVVKKDLSGKERMVIVAT